jgi:acetylornithine deacetylase/succinyl-diaminopimelate desuccinylase-like protein
VRDLVGEEGFTPAERSSARPTLDVNGIWGGFQGAGVKTVIPSEAHAKITCRLVPDQRPDRIVEALQAYVTAHTPWGVDVSVEPLAGSALPYLMPRDFWANRAAAATLADLYGVPPYYRRLGSTLPLAGTLLDLLDTYTVTLGFSLDDERFHAPDEFFRLSSFRGAQRGWATLLHRLGEMWPDSDGE